ncbi:hypothetical protein [Solibacillus isronensis]|uniref:hypothetical protein n=1 Tax=Solibacillus isronensis TaxID=412383 RepID=UPI00399F9E87
MMMQTEKTHFEVMEELGQLTIFDIPQVQREAEVIEESPLKIGDKVRCQIDMSESEAYYYLKYYYPNALTSIGEIVDIDGNVIFVRFKGEIVQLERHQIKL